MSKSAWSKVIVTTGIHLRDILGGKLFIFSILKHAYEFIQTLKKSTIFLQRVAGPCGEGEAGLFQPSILCAIYGRSEGCG